MSEQQVAEMPTSFAQEYETLLAEVKVGSRLSVGRSLNACIDQYSVTDSAALQRQVQLTADAVWTDQHQATSWHLRTLMGSYLKNTSNEKPTTSFLDHPSIIRTCLAMANFVDDEGITMNSTERDAVTSFLLSLPGTADADNRVSPLLPRVARALLGEQWAILCTLYDIPQEGIQEFRQAIAGLSASLLKMPVATGTPMVELPGQMDV